MNEVRTEEGYDDDHELGRDVRIRLHRGSGSERRHGFARKEDGDELRRTAAWLLGAEGGVTRCYVGAAKEVRVLGVDFGDGVDESKEDCWKAEESSCFYVGVRVRSSHRDKRG